MFHRIIFLLLIVSSLSCNFNRCAVCFQSFMNIACRSTQNAAHIKRFWRLHIVIKPLNKNKPDKFFIMLQSNSLNVHSNTPKLATGWPYRWFWIFLSGFAISPRVVRSFWIFNECNLYFRIVKYCILSKVCLSNAKNSTWFVFQA